MNIETKRDENGALLIRGKCSVCKQCWIYLGGSIKGKCPYGGPFSGYVKQEQESHDNDSKRDRLEL